jgi:hypothetical protein
MRSLATLVLLGVLAGGLTSCVSPDPKLDGPTTGREMKQLLDELNVECEEFDVRTDDVPGAEVLSCLDGTASKQPYLFVIWESQDRMSSSLRQFCFDLNRKGNAAFEIIVEQSWIAYSASSFISASALASELGAEVESGESFCLEQGFEVAPVLSVAGIEHCQALMDSAEGLESVDVVLLAQTYRANESEWKNFNLEFISVSQEELGDLARSLRDPLRQLEIGEEIPMDLRAAAGDFEWNEIVLASTTGPNGGYLGKFFPYRDKSLTSEEERNYWNRQVRTHNEKLTTFDAVADNYKRNLETIIELCEKYAPFS